MPEITTPIQPQYDDALAMEEMQQGYGIPLPLSQRPEAQTYKQFVPNAKDIQGMALQEQYTKMQQQALQQQQAGIQKYQDDIDLLRNKETQVDLSPLAALADSWGIAPSNFAETYKRPMSRDEKNNQVMALQEKLQAQKDKQSDNRNQALATALKAYTASKEQPLKDEVMRSTVRKNDAIGNMIMMPGQKAADVDYGKAYADWRAKGGYAKMEENLNFLEQAAQALEKDPSLTGGNSAYAPDSLRLKLNPQGYAMQQDVEKAGLAGLRQNMGPQFTEKEGQAFLKRLFDPRQSAQENVKKIRAEMANLRAQAQANEASANYFEKTGTLKGLDTSTNRMSAPSTTGAAAPAAPAPVTWTPEDAAQEKALADSIAKRTSGGQ